MTPEKRTISPRLLYELSDRAAGRIFTVCQNELNKPLDCVPKLYGVPRGGISAVLAISGHMSVELTDDPREADVIVDDLVDSGRTKERFIRAYPDKPFIALLDKSEERFHDQWIIWPWEGTSGASIEDNIVRLLQYVGEEPGRAGLAETPARVAKAWEHWCGGYKMDVSEVFKTFEDGAEKYDQMITRKEIPFYSHCEHHMAPIIGRCTIAYIPNGKILGLSKMDRLVDIFARRLQVQERLTSQIADAMHEGLKAKGVGVRIDARHLCIESRGVKHQHSDTVTTALRGVMHTEDATRAEFLRLVQ